MSWSGQSVLACFGLLGQTGILGRTSKNLFAKSAVVNRIQEKCQPRYDAGYDEDWFVEPRHWTLKFMSLIVDCAFE